MYLQLLEIDLKLFLSKKEKSGFLLNIFKFSVWTKTHTNNLTLTLTLLYGKVFKSL